MSNVIAICTILILGFVLGMAAFVFYLALKSFDSE